jgi:hypothetical protein
MHSYSKLQYSLMYFLKQSLLVSILHGWELVSPSLNVSKLKAAVVIAIVKPLKQIVARVLSLLDPPAGPEGWSSEVPVLYECVYLSQCWMAHTQRKPFA